MSSTARVVVTGMGVVSAVGCSVADFEAALRAGTSGIVARPDPDGPHGPGREVRAAALLNGFSWHEPVEGFLVSDLPALTRARRILSNTTDSTRWSVVAAIEAFRGAALVRNAEVSAGTGLIVAGNNLGQAYGYRNVARLSSGTGRINPKYAVSFMDTNQLGCTSEILGIRGGVGWTVGAASASGNVALYQAWQLVRSGVCERCLAIGAGTEFSPAEFEAFGVLGAASVREPPGGDPRRLCRPFDRAHSGFVWGEGAAAMMLESEASAKRRSRLPLAELLGASVVLDGTHLPEPSEAGEAQAMEDALRAAGLGADEIDYLNAHGSSSPLGDRTECAAVRRVFRERAGRIRINATKALTGHCIGASGLLEAVACVLQMRGGFLHPNPHLAQPIDDGLRFVGTHREEGEVRYAISNGFGFGGINASVVFGPWGRRD